MEVRFKLTKYRVAIAALFVLAGIGLGNLLSPLVGSALATVGQTVNISDNSASANFAKVDSSGALKTTGTVTGGNVSISAPQSAFNFPVLNNSDSVPKDQFGATNATLAFTGFRVVNKTSAQLTLALYQFPESSTGCALNVPGYRFLGEFAVQTGDTVVEQLTTPQLLKPFGGKPYWCLVAAGAANGNQFSVNYSGYVASGSFVPPVVSSAQPALRASRKQR
jgi:hypothetical protein